MEGIAELQDFVADVIDRYPRCRIDGTRFVLVEARDRVMPEIPPESRRVRHARAARRAGWRSAPDTTLTSVEQDAVTLSDR